MKLRASSSLVSSWMMSTQSISCSLGDSAGGNLAASVSLLARELGEFTPRTQILLYPLVDNDHTLTSMFDSVRENGEDYILTREDINGYVRSLP